MATLAEGPGAALEDRDAPIWSHETEQHFESALLRHWENASRLQLAASELAGFDESVLAERYAALAGDIEAIDGGRVELPTYPEDEIAGAPDGNVPGEAVEGARAGVRDPDAGITVDVVERDLHPSESPWTQSGGEEPSGGGGGEHAAAEGEEANGRGRGEAPSPLAAPANTSARPPPPGATLAAAVAFQQQLASQAGFPFGLLPGAALAGGHHSLIVQQLAAAASANGTGPATGAGGGDGVASGERPGQPDTPGVSGGSGLAEGSGAEAHRGVADARGGDMGAAVIVAGGPSGPGVAALRAPTAMVGLRGDSAGAVGLVAGSLAPKPPRHPQISQPSPGDKRKGVSWSEEEHKLFLLGLHKHGKGDWRSISRNFVTTRTPTQVASHAQKYFIRQAAGKTSEKRRVSIHDITTVEPGLANLVAQQNQHAGRGGFGPSAAAAAANLGNVRGGLAGNAPGLAGLAGLASLAGLGGLGGFAGLGGMGPYGFPVAAAAAAAAAAATSTVPGSSTAVPGGASGAFPNPYLNGLAAANLGGGLANAGPAAGLAPGAFAGSSLLSGLAAGLPYPGGLGAVGLGSFPGGLGAGFGGLPGGGLFGSPPGGAVGLPGLPSAGATAVGACQPDTAASPLSGAQAGPAREGASESASRSDSRQIGGDAAPSEASGDLETAVVVAGGSGAAADEVGSAEGRGGNGGGEGSSLSPAPATADPAAPPATASSTPPPAGGDQYAPPPLSAEALNNPELLAQAFPNGIPPLLAQSLAMARSVTGGTPPPPGLFGMPFTAAPGMAPFTPAALLAAQLAGAGVTPGVQPGPPGLPTGLTPGSPGPLPQHSTVSGTQPPPVPAISGAPAADGLTRPVPADAPA